MLNKFLEEDEKEYVIRHIRFTPLERSANGVYMGEPCIRFKGNRKEYLRRSKEIFVYNFREDKNVSIEKYRYFDF